MNELFLEIGERAVREAGSILIKRYGKEVSVKTKKDGTQVSKLDILSEQSIIRTLTESDMGFSIRGEETNAIHSGSDYTWIIDPLSNTKGYLQKNGDFAISLALLDKTGVFLGFVFDPMHDDLYIAQRNSGSFLNKEKIQTVKKRQKNPSVFINRWCKESFPDMMKLTSDVTVLSDSIALAMCRNSTSNKPHTLVLYSDVFSTAAASLFLKETGCVCTDMQGNELDFNGMSSKKEYGIICSADKMFHAHIMKTITNFL
ncbi:inositol monophosphatase family protein [Patescibacteria group bacterium]|nr:inositol monophosphatase family protein [Patescibacteria group bacterium]